jgi:hypothetical protein
MTNSNLREPARAWASALCRTGLEDDLSQPFAVAQIDEDRPSVVPSILNPAKQHHGLTFVRPGELTTGMGTFDLIDEVEGHGRFF